MRNVRASRASVVGHTNLSAEGRWLAAVLACGDGAVLSHESAAALWGISPRCPTIVHVTVPSHSGRARREGIRLHRSVTLTTVDTTRRRNIPVTTHARTLDDLGYGTEPTRSHLERLFLRICRRHGIPRPEVNARIGDLKGRGIDVLRFADRELANDGRALARSLLAHIRRRRGEAA